MLDHRMNVKKRKVSNISIGIPKIIFFRSLLVAEQKSALGRTEQVSIKVGVVELHRFNRFWFFELLFHVHHPV
jgi:hypothetical protein